MICSVIFEREGVKEFQKKKMALPAEVVNDLLINDIKKIHPKNLPSHRQKAEETGKVRFSLADSYERDLVISYSSNLRGDDKLEVVIPLWMKTTTN